MENPLRGIALLIGATMFFSVSDAISKVLGARLPAIEISSVRYVVFVIMAAALCRHTHSSPLRVRSWRMQVLRGLGLVGSALFFIESLRYLPLADAASIGFVSPLFITLLSVPVLGEVVGIRRWSALVVGLIGVLVVIRPGTGAFQPAALWVIASSTSWALASVLTRRMAGGEDAAVTLLWSASIGLIVVLILLPLVWLPPTAEEIGLMLLLGVIASTGQFLMVQAYRHAGAAMLAPFSYIQLAWSTSLGWVIWGTLPDHFTWIGTAIIVASGLYTANRERIRARQHRQPGRG